MVEIFLMMFSTALIFALRIVYVPWSEELSTKKAFIPFEAYIILFSIRLWVCNNIQTLKKHTRKHYGSQRTQLIFTPNPIVYQGLISV